MSTAKRNKLFRRRRRQDRQYRRQTEASNSSLFCLLMTKKYCDKGCIILREFKKEAANKRAFTSNASLPACGVSLQQFGLCWTPTTKYSESVQLVGSSLVRESRLCPEPKVGELAVQKRRATLCDWKSLSSVPLFLAKSKLNSFSSLHSWSLPSWLTVFKKRDTFSTLLANYNYAFEHCYALLLTNL